MQHKSLIFKPCRLVLLALIPAFLSACSTLGYYSQSVRGQVSVMSKRVPIKTIIADKKTTAQQKALLENILSIRQFASKQLLLPDNKSYTTYVDLDQAYVVWNVFAAPEFSLTPISSCFLVVGCLQYRGFFAKQDALDYAHELRKANNDVFVGGVSAYSTLGWFDDPVLSSMLTYGEFRLAEVIFHELAHQLIYIKDDSEFNEAFATAVGEMGVRRWLQKNQREDDLKRFTQSKQWEIEFIQLVLETRRQLKRLYESDLPVKEMRKKKTLIFDQLRSDYAALKASWDNPPDYDNWMNHDLNNAKIASVVTYYDLTKSFATLLALSNDDLVLFYQRVKHLGTLDKEIRHDCLQNLTNNPSDQINC